MLDYKIKLIADFLKATDYKGSVYQFIKESSWKENKVLCINILKNQLTPEQKRDINKRSTLLDHYRDKRKPIDYFKNIILNWIVEDRIITLIKESGSDADLYGGDKERRIASNPSNISGKPDIKIIFENEVNMLLEVATGWYYEEKRVILLRDNKYPNLKNDKSHVIFLDTKYRMDYVIFNILDVEAEFRLKIKRYGNKPGYAISSDKFVFSEIFWLKHDLSILYYQNKYKTQ